MTYSEQDLREADLQGCEDGGATALSAARAEGQVATPEMILAGARSIGATMRWDNHTERSKACWDAMQAARNDVEHPIPVQPLSTIEQIRSEARKAALEEAIKAAEEKCLNRQTAVWPSEIIDAIRALIDKVQG